MKVRGILIDPFAKTVKSTFQPYDETAHVYAAVGSYDVSHVALTPKMQMVFDDQGMYRRKQEWFKLGQMPYPTAGKVLLLGISEDGGIADVPVLSTVTIEQAVEWLDPMTAQCLFPPPQGDPYGFETLDHALVAMPVSQ